jgi:hypothetical protein
MQFASTDANQLLEDSYFLLSRLVRFVRLEGSAAPLVSLL